MSNKLTKQEIKIIRQAIKLMKKLFGKKCKEYCYHCWQCRNARVIEEFENMFEETVED